MSLNTSQKIHTKKIKTMRIFSISAFLAFLPLHYIFVIPVTGFSHHKRPVVYIGQEMPKHSQKVWTKPDFKHYLPQDFYYNRVMRHDDEYEQKTGDGHLHEEVKNKNKVHDKYRWIPDLLNRIKLSFD